MTKGRTERESEREKRVEGKRTRGITGEILGTPNGATLLRGATC
jgi:hypothetical protein